jgi:hypothetical protein
MAVGLNTSTAALEKPELKSFVSFNNKGIAESKTIEPVNETKMSDNEAF